MVLSWLGWIPLPQMLNHSQAKILWGLPFCQVPDGLKIILYGVSECSHFKFFWRTLCKLLYCFWFVCVCFFPLCSVPKCLGHINRNNHNTCLSGCGGRLHTDRGVLSSPHYPNNYLPGLNCSWHVMVTPGFRVSVTFQSPFQIQGYGTHCSSGDYLEVKKTYGLWNSHESKIMDDSFIKY